MRAILAALSRRWILQSVSCVVVTQYMDPKRTHAPSAPVSSLHPKPRNGCEGSCGRELVGFHSFVVSNVFAGGANFFNKTRSGNRGCMINIYRSDSFHSLPTPRHHRSTSERDWRIVRSSFLYIKIAGVRIPFFVSREREGVYIVYIIL